MKRAMYSCIFAYFVLVFIKIYFDILNGRALDNENYRITCGIIGKNPIEPPNCDSQENSF